jgi:hypothetical protein
MRLAITSCRGRRKRDVRRAGSAIVLRQANIKFERIRKVALPFVGKADVVADRRRAGEINVAIGLSDLWRGCRIDALSRHMARPFAPIS